MCKVFVGNMLQISQSVLFHLTDNTVCGPAETSQRPVKYKRGRKTLPQQFQVLIPDMMVFFHFLSKLIVLLSELLTESLEKQKSQYLAPVCIMKSTFAFKIFRETLSRKQLPLIRKVSGGIREDVCRRPCTALPPIWHSS